MATSTQTQQPAAATWTPTANQLESRSFGLPEQSAVDAAPAAFESRAFTDSVTPTRGVPDMQARLGEEQQDTSLLDFTQVNLFAGSAPSDPPPVQRSESATNLDTEVEEESEDSSEDTIQRKCAACGAEDGEDKPIQPKLAIGQPGDKYEQEADRVAAQVVTMPDTALQRQTDPDSASPVLEAPSPLAAQQFLQTKGGKGTASADFEQRLQNTKGSGTPLGDDVRGFMEPRFGADFGQVRVHTDATAVQLNQEVGAHAFTHGNDLYFNAGKYAPGSTSGKELLAHELTHTIQQTGGTRINKAPALKQREAEEPPVHAKTVQKNIVPLKANSLQSKAEEEETLQAKSLGQASANYAVENHPAVQLKAIEDKTVQPKTINDLEQAATGNKKSPFKPTSSPAEASEGTLQPKSAESLPEHAISQVSQTMDGKPVQTKLAISSAPTSIQRWGVGSWILDKVGQLASNMPGFTLLCTLLGKNPVTGKAVERSATSVIGGILTFIGQGQLFQQLKESNAIENAFAWFSKQIAKLNLTWAVISGLFKKAWDSLSKWDLLSPVKAFNRIATIFSGPIKRIRNFASSVISKVGEFIFEGAMKLAGVAGKRVMGIIKQAGGVIGNIIKNPIGFVGNLIKAVKGGFTRFAANIATHLKSGLMGWLFGALAGAGLTLPKTFDLKGILDITLQVIGATYANARKMLVDKIGEKRVEKLEKAFAFVKMLATEGLAGAWRKLMEFAGNLTDMVIGGIKNWVMKSVVGAAITKLVTMFNPAGAVVQAIISIYNTIMFFVERAQQIAALATSVFKSIGKIAAGNVGAAVTFIEQAMARTLPVIISFLARQVGLGDVAGAIKGIIGRVQGVIQGAIGKLVNFIVSRAKGLLGRFRGQGSSNGKTEKFTQKDKDAGLASFEKAEKPFIKNNQISKEDAQNVVHKVKKQHPVFKSITVVDGNDSWDYQYIFRSKVDTNSKKKTNNNSQGHQTSEPMMPEGLSKEKKAKWIKCNQLYKTYKRTQQDVASLGSEIKALSDKFYNNRLSEIKHKEELHAMAVKQHQIVERLIVERRRYIDAGGDEFDWMNKGNTEQERRRRHLGEINNVRAQKANLLKLIRELSTAIMKQDEQARKQGI